MIHILHSAFHWFYCLPIVDAVLLAGLGSLVFLFLKKHLNQKLLWKWIIFVILLTWMITIVFTTIGNRDIGSTMQHNFIPFHSYREVWAGGNPEILRSNFMNAVLFYPAGLLFASLLPRTWKWWHSVVLTLLLLTLVSVGIEYIQYAYALGRAEIDDVIHNAIGTLLGSIISVLNLKLIAHNSL